MRKFILFTSLSLLTLLIACKCDDDTRPDLLVPEYITPDLVQKYFNAFDFSGTSYRNEYYFSNAWQRNGPFYIPYNFMAPYLPTSYLYYPYYDPYGRFTINWVDVNGICEVYFAQGLWNQGGWIYWGQFNNGLYTGDIVQVYKYVFNDKNDNLSSVCNAKSAEESKLRIKVVSEEKIEKTEETDVYVPEIAPNTYVVTVTTFIVNQQGFYKISSTADIYNDVDERDEDNNDEEEKIVSFSKNLPASSFFLDVNGPNLSDEHIVTFIKNNDLK